MKLSVGARRPLKGARPTPGAVDDGGVPPAVLAEWWTPFAEHLALERRCSAYTVRNYRQAFEDFYRWLAAAGLWQKGLDALGPRDVRDFVIEAQRRFDRRTLHNHVSGLRTFGKFWRRQGRLHANPFVGVPLPKLEKRLPKFLTEEQMKLLLAGPERLIREGAVDPFTAWRDRLALELLYGGGLRVSELVGLDYGAMDAGAGIARVRGKGGKERLCPLGRTAQEVLARFRGEFARVTGPAGSRPHDPGRAAPRGARRAAHAQALPRPGRAPRTSRRTSSATPMRPIC